MNDLTVKGVISEPNFEQFQNDLTVSLLDILTTFKTYVHLVSNIFTLELEKLLRARAEFVKVKPNLQTLPKTK